MHSKSSLFKRLLVASALAGAGIATAHAGATLAHWTFTRRLVK